MHLELQSVDLIPFLNTPDQWLECQFLSNQSIHIQWQSLSQIITLREMKIQRCLNCNQYTHIINYETNRLLINRELYVMKEAPKSFPMSTFIHFFSQNDQTAKHLYSSPNYSKVIKIVLPNGNDSVGKRDLSGVQGNSFELEKHPLILF